MGEVQVCGCTSELSRYRSQIDAARNKASSCIVFQYNPDGSKFIRKDLTKECRPTSVPTIKEVVDKFSFEKKEKEYGKLRTRAEKRTQGKRNRHNKDKV